MEGYWVMSQRGADGLAARIPYRLLGAAAQAPNPWGLASSTPAGILLAWEAPRVVEEVT